MIAILAVSVAMFGIPIIALDVPAAFAYTAPARTASIYESTTSTATLADQGIAQAGNGRSGVVILDFGRPAASGSTNGFIDFGGGFVSMSSVLSAVESYATAWYGYSSSAPFLTIAIGTNNSFTANSGNCPCSDQVSNLGTWGNAFAGIVNSFSTFISNEGYYTQEVAAGADDAEPAYDPQWGDTHSVLVGYNTDSSRTMWNYGSNESGFWSPAELLEASWGFPDDVTIGQVYTTTHASNWENLILYDRSQSTYHTDMIMYGIMTSDAELSVTAAYNDMMTDLNSHSSTAQTGIEYVTTING
ncbi:MAG: hypothetical protein ABSA02_26210 [Trebonia sp.]